MTENIAMPQKPYLVVLFEKENSCEILHKSWIKCRLSDGVSTERICYVKSCVYALCFCSLLLCTVVPDCDDLHRSCKILFCKE